jgi:hypothetical protein
VITEMEAVALMDEANPVPDLDSYDVANPGVAAYLTDLEQGSSVVTQLDTKSAEGAEMSKKRGLWLAAAVIILVLGFGVAFLTQVSDDTPVVATPETIESITLATLGEKLISVGNYQLRESGYFFTVEFEEINVPEDIQTTSKTLAEAFMLQGVETIGITVRVPEPSLDWLVIGAMGTIVNLYDTSEAVLIDWTPQGHKYSPEDFTFEGCVACP